MAELRVGINQSLSAPGVQPRMPAQPAPFAEAFNQLLGGIADTTQAAVRVAEQDDIRRAMESESQGKPIPSMLTRKGYAFAFQRAAINRAASITDDDALYDQLQKDSPGIGLAEQFQGWLDNNSANMPPEYRLTLKDEMLPRLTRAYDRKQSAVREAHFKEGGQALSIAFGAGEITDEKIANKEQYLAEWTEAGGARKDALTAIYKTALDMRADSADLAGVRRLEELATADGVADLASGVFDRARTLYEARESDSIDTAMLTNPEMADTLVNNVMNDENILNKSAIVARIQSRSKELLSEQFRARDRDATVKHLQGGAINGGAATIPDVINPATGARIPAKERIEAAVNDVMPALSFPQQVKFLFNAGTTYEPWRKALSVGARGALPGQPVPVNVKAGYQLHDALSKMEGGAALLGEHEDERAASFYALLGEVVAETGDNPADPSDASFHLATQAMTNLPKTEQALKNVPAAVKAVKDYKDVHNYDTMRVAIENRARLYTRLYDVSAERAVAMAVKSLNERYAISNGWWIPRGQELPNGEVIGQRAITKYLSEPVDEKTGEPATGKTPFRSDWLMGLKRDLSAMTGNPSPGRGDKGITTRADYYELDPDEFALMPRDNGQYWDLVNMNTMRTVATASRAALLKEHDDFIQAELRTRTEAAKADYQERRSKSTAAELMGTIVPLPYSKPRRATTPEFGGSMGPIAQ